jgi:methyl-accepting chemotaxis protein
MAKEVIIELKAKTDKIEQDVEGINKEIKTLNKNVDKTAEGFEGVEKASQDTAKGVKKIGTTLKAIGIGLLLAAFTKLKEVFEENQKVADAFATTFEFLSLAFNDFFNFLDANVGTVIGYFKSIFEDPKQSLIDFANAFKRNIQERFESYLDTLGFLASAVKKVFSGDFAGALEDVKNAGKESLDVLTGVDNTFDKTVETVTKVTKAVTEYTKSTFESAKANVELQKTANIAIE